MPDNIDKHMRDVQKLSGGGRVTITKPESGSAFYARVFPTHLQASKRVIERLKAGEPASYTPAEMADLFVREEETPLAYGSGKTVKNALINLKAKLKKP